MLNDAFFFSILNIGFSIISISLFTKLVRDEVSATSAISSTGVRANTGMSNYPLHSISFFSESHEINWDEISIIVPQWQALPLITSLFFIFILIFQFLVLGSSDFEDAFKAAVLMNVYNKRAAAAAHLCQAWSQLVDISVLGCGGVLVQGGSIISFTLRHIFNIVSDYYNTTFHSSLPSSLHPSLLPDLFWIPQQWVEYLIQPQSQPLLVS